MEAFFKNNKESFDRLSPNEASWDSIKAGIHKKKKRRKRFVFLKMAAAILLVLGLSIGYFTDSNQSYSVFEDLSMASPHGETIALDPSSNKYTLVQFWESGNLLCTEDNCYYYLPAYEKYKSRGFEIYAISLDKNKESWVLGIEENNLPWIHVSDLKGWESPVCIECNISKVPTSFLLDQKGAVIARDLNAEDLDGTLDHLLAQN